MDYRLTALAEGDLREIAYYSMMHWGEMQARYYEAHFVDAFAAIANDPLLLTSRACDHLLSGARLLVVQQHIVIYRPVKETVQILRILHQRMNLSLHALISP